MSAHRSDAGVNAPVEIGGEARKLRRSHESMDLNPLVQRVQLKFRQAVGQAMEEIADEKIREGIKAIQQEVVELLKKLQQESGLEDAALQLFEDEIIQAKVNAFTAMTVLETQREILHTLKQENQQLKTSLDSSQEELRMEMYDELTGVLKKKYLLSGFRNTLSHLQREAFTMPVPISVLFFDVDHFKRVNDNFGHMAGDDVLSKIGEIVANKFPRKNDTVGKFGGEEFVVVLPGCNEYNAGKLAEDLRREIENLTFKCNKDGKIVEFKVTVSIGALAAILHKFPNDDFEKIMEGMIKQADGLMYQGKHGGRNRVVVSQVQIGEVPEDEVLL